MRQPDPLSEQYQPTYVDYLFDVQYGDSMTLGTRRLIAGQPYEVIEAEVRRLCMADKGSVRF